MNFEIPIPKSLEARIRRDVTNAFNYITEPNRVREAISEMIKDFHRGLLEKAVGVRYRSQHFRDEIIVDPDSEAAINQLTQYKKAVAELLADFKVELTEAEKKRMLRTYRQAFIDKLERVMSEQARDDAGDYAAEMVVTIVREADKLTLDEDDE